VSCPTKAIRNTRSSNGPGNIRLNELERAWGALDLSGEDEFLETIPRPAREPETRSQTIADHLSQRMGYMREAIRVAREADGYFTIS
jgi:hypothetical protein